MFIDKGAILMMFATGNVKKTEIFSLVQRSSLAQRRFTLAQYGISISIFLALLCYIFGNFAKSMFSKLLPLCLLVQDLYVIVFYM